MQGLVARLNHSTIKKAEPQLALPRAINWLMIIIALQLEPFAQRL